MATTSHMRSYLRSESITFRKTNESFGGLSNMASGFVLWVNGTRILTSEALYQACRFPHLPEMQRSIIMQGSPMTAKMKSKPFRDQSRADWNGVRLNIMRWCLRVKLAQHWDKFSELLLRTGDKSIVEDSRKDQFWGAVLQPNGMLEGRNALGRLLMELREELKGANRELLRSVQPIDIPDFLLYGQPIGVVEARPVKQDAHSAGRRLKPLGTRRPDEPTKTYAPPPSKADLFSEPEPAMNVNNSKPQEPLKPYPTYKPTAIPWLQQVPEHWDWKRAKSLFRIVDVKSKTGREELLTVSSANGIVRRRESNVNMFKAKTYVGHKLCWPEDLVINSLWAWGRGLGFAREHGIISSAYGVYRLRPEQRYLWRYLDYTLRSAAYQWELQVRSKGVWKSRLQLSDASFLDMPILIPPKEDAELIVRYLHALEAKVKRYIRAKRSLIARLQEQKQAIIQRAVTRGLDPNVRLKPSGSVWLDEIPENWTGLPLKRWLATPITDGPHETPVLHDDGVPFMSAESMVNGRLDFNRKRGFISEEDHRTYCVKLRPRRDDIFMCKSGATTGKIAIVETDDEFSVWSPLALIRVDRTKVIPRLLFQLLQVPYVQRQVQMTWSAGTQPNLSMGAMARLFVALPGLSEQERILEFVKTETGPIDRTIGRVQKEIDFMLEYHTRLIADVVTGAVDVRAAAQALREDQMISGSEDQIMEEESLSMAAEGEAEYGEE